MSDYFYEDMRIGDKVATANKTVTEADIVNFSYLSGDWFPLHTDEEYAKKTVFGGRIAHGMLVLSLASGLTVRAGILSPKSLIAFYGMEGVRFTNPVRIGDTIRVEVEVVGKEEKGTNKGLVTTRCVVKNQRDETVATMDMKVLVQKRQSISK